MKENKENSQTPQDMVAGKPARNPGCLTTSSVFSLLAAFLVVDAFFVSVGVFLNAGVSPPNDYVGFLYRGGHYVWNVGALLNHGMFPSLLMGMTVACIAVWLLLFASMFPRSNLQRFNGNRRFVLAGLFIVAVGVGIGGFHFACRAFGDVLNAFGPSWPKLAYRDTPELRSEYDRMCVEWYDAWEPSSLPVHSLMSDDLVMRKDAPQEVKDAYARFQRRRQAAVDAYNRILHTKGGMADAARQGFAHGKDAESPEVLGQVRAAARTAVESGSSASEGAQSGNVSAP